MTRGGLERLVRVWQRRLGLERWRISIAWDEPADPENLAQVHTPDDYDIATIRFDAGWAKWTPEFAEPIVVHELLHCLHDDVDVAVDSVLGKLQQDARDLFADRYRHELETLVDRLAYRLVELAA